MFCNVVPRYFPYDASVTPEEEGKQVKLSWDEGDKAIIQVDMSSLQPESNALETMTVYKYLLLLEKHKRVTSYEISYSTCKRRDSASGGDGFEIAPKELQVYKTTPDLTKQLTCKSVFWDCFAKVKSSSTLLTVFRFRFDRVHAVTKVQKPYVFSKAALSLEAGKPIEVIS